MLALKSLVLGGLLLALHFSDAHASAIAGVGSNRINLSVWDGQTDDFVYVPRGQPNLAIHLVSATPTLMETESGNASVAFSYGATDRSGSITGSAHADPGGYALGSYSVVFKFDITNIGDVDYSYVQLLVDFSAFNPGGGQTGAMVSDRSTEFARFLSRQSGPIGLDFHACDTRTSSSFLPPPAAACGVLSPDSSFAWLTLLDLDAGSTKEVNFTLTMELEVSSPSVPVPGMLGLLLGALFTLSLCGRMTQTN